MPRRTLNLGILAHVDAGKTTLTERLLYAAGVIDTIGSVDAGTTQTDSLALERQRGITIRSAVVSFAVGGVTVNLIDTPGHPDFIAEVERVLSVLDGAVLVISAVEGVQPQTRVLMRALRRLRIPALLFVNKIDRAGAGEDRILRAISARLSPAVVPMGSAPGLGTRAAGFTPWREGDAGARARLAEILAERDEGILAAYVDNELGLPYARLRQELAAQARRALVYPVFFGSAVTGAGVPPLMAGLTELLPAGTGDAAGPVSGRVFKIERGPGGEKLAYVRMFSGTIRTRDRLRFGGDHEGKVTAIGAFEPGPAGSRPSVSAGQIAKLRGLDEIQIGDEIGHGRPGVIQPQFAPPALESVVVARRPADRAALRVALGQACAAFFALPQAAKMEIAMARGGPAWRGYFPVGAELTSGRPDLKEGLYFAAGYTASPTVLFRVFRYPAPPPGDKGCTRSPAPTVTTCWARCPRCSRSSAARC